MPAVVVVDNAVGQYRGSSRHDAHLARIKNRDPTPNETSRPANGEKYSISEFHIFFFGGEWRDMYQSGPEINPINGETY